MSPTLLVERVVDTAAATATDDTMSLSDCSSRWVWMKDAKSRLCHPIDPVDQWDIRPTISELCVKYRADIDQLKDQLATNELFDENCHDDLWILRFVLSHHHNSKSKNCAHSHAALEAIQATLKFRHEYHLDELDLRHFHAGSVTALAEQVAQVQQVSSTASSPNNGNINNVCESHIVMMQAAVKMVSCYQGDTTMIYYLPDRQRGMLGILQVAQRQQHQMIQVLTTQDEYFQAHLFFSEWKFQWMDYLTRTTGRLTKYLNLADCHGVKRTMIHKESKKRDAKAAQVLQDKYPQLLGSMLITNAPTWINVVFAILKPFLAKRLLDKVNVLSNKKKNTEKDVMAILHYCAAHHLPQKYGGLLPDSEWPPALAVTL
jgi:CRAL/TRIO domain